MFRNFILLLVFAWFTAALPSSITTQSVDPTSTAAPPIDIDLAKQIFEKNVTNIPHIIPNIVEPHPKPRPTSTEVPPTATGKGIPDPDTFNTTAIRPGIPKSGIQVEPPQNIPISSIVGTNQSHPIPSSLTTRQSCPDYPYCCPDPRSWNENTNYPYSVIGRVWNNGLQCSGTLVGPRHVLTAAHCISWDVCHQTTNGEVQFAPDYWPGHAPEIFYGNTVYFYYASACGDPTNLFQEAVDYVIVVLDEETGLPYVGLKDYNTAWNGGDYWDQQGYAADAGGGFYPYYQAGFSVVNDFPQYWADLLEYTACITPGDSGSPVFSWWSDGPYIVGLTTEVGSQLGADASWGPGGQAMINLVNQAIAEYP